MKTRKYFFDLKPKGLNADLKRHREEENRIKAILEIATKENNTAVISIYQHSLNALWESKAMLVEKLGRKKDA